jgi:hypothetical protein
MTVVQQYFMVNELGFLTIEDDAIYEEIMSESQAKWCKTVNII